MSGRSELLRRVGACRKHITRNSPSAISNLGAHVNGEFPSEPNRSSWRRLADPRGHPRLIGALHGLPVRPPTLQPSEGGLPPTSAVGFIVGSEGVARGNIKDSQIPIGRSGHFGYPSDRVSFHRYHI